MNVTKYCIVLIFVLGALFNYQLTMENIDGKFSYISNKPPIWHISVESTIRYNSNNNDYGLLYIGRSVW